MKDTANIDSNAIAPPDPWPSVQSRVLVIDRSAKQLKRVSQIVRPVVSHLEAQEHFEQVPSDRECDLLIINYDELTGAERDGLMDACSNGNKKARLLLLSDGRCRSDLATLFGSKALTNLVASTGEVDARELIVTVQKILRRNIFGLEKYFVWGIEPVLIRLTRSNQKADTLQRAEEYVERVGIGSRLARLFYTVVDEFVTNAIYNAPTDADGRHRFAHLARTEEVTLSPGEEVTLRFCFDGYKLGVSIEDPFGSLTEVRILEYLAKCFRKGADQVDSKAGGAGLGLYYIFDALSCFVVNIDPGKKTEMIGLIDVTNSYKDFASKGKSFNIFMGK